ncbi:MAG: diaminopimelate epimerase [Acidimicrobiales bacterium]|jgi:diaminopimelate epimerase|nr:diaminopimelate epimerase [Acidimicrobiales bacterium]
MAVRYSKHHGLGNDFLVTLTDSLPLDAGDRAISLCDRTTGIGADGLIFGLQGLDGSMGMRLLNSDGSPAELSGNGLRCFAQAVARHRGVPHLEIDVDTPAGVRHCSVHATPDRNTIVATVDMGVVCPGPDPDVDDLIAHVGDAVRMVKRWETGDIGNPHVICEVDDPSEVDLLVAGPAIESHFEDGANVHFVAVTGLNELSVRVWERGAGVTNACGTGATVSAQLFHNWDLVGPKVVVRMPGGDALVDLQGPVTLTGPATHIADIEVPDA